MWVVHLVRDHNCIWFYRSQAKRRKQFTKLFVQCTYRQWKSISDNTIACCEWQYRPWHHTDWLTDWLNDWLTVKYNETNEHIGDNFSHSIDINSIPSKRWNSLIESLCILAVQMLLPHTSVQCIHTILIATFRFISFHLIWFLFFAIFYLSRCFRFHFFANILLNCLSSTSGERAHCVCFTIVRNHNKIHFPQH